MEPYVPVVMVVLGLATHQLKELARISVEERGNVHPVRYWTKFPYQTALCVVGAATGYFALLETGQLSGLTAFGVGYMSNSVADILGKRSLDKLS